MNYLYKEQGIILTFHTFVNNKFDLFTVFICFRVLIQKIVIIARPKIRGEV